MVKCIAATGVTSLLPIPVSVVSMPLSRRSLSPNWTMLSTRKACATKLGVPDSWWLKCPKLDPVFSTTIPVVGCRADQSASCLQQFWLDPVSPLVHILEKAGEQNFLTETIMAIQHKVLQILPNLHCHLCYIVPTLH